MSFFTEYGMRSERKGIIIMATMLYRNFIHFFECSMFPYLQTMAEKDAQGGGDNEGLNPGGSNDRNEQTVVEMHEFWFFFKKICFKTSC